MSARQQYSPKIEGSPDSAKAWWQEWECWLLVGFVAGIFLLQSARLNLQADEARRGYAAAEILRTGNWFPADEKAPQAAHAPLGNSLVAICGMLRGDVDKIAIRLPSVIVLALTSLVLYAATRQFFTKAGALTAAGAYPTMMQVFESGRGAEDEVLAAALLISASLLAWCVGRWKSWNALTVWVVGYFSAALVAACFGGIDGNHPGRMLPALVFVSILCGTVVQHCVVAPDAALSTRSWRVFLSGSAILAAMLGALVAVSPLINRPWAYDINPNPWLGLAFAAVALAIAGVLVGGAIGPVRQSAGRCALCLMAFLGVAHSLIVVNAHARNEPDMAERVTQLLSHSRPDSQLVSLGPIDPAFAYYVHRPVELVELPVSKTADDVPVEMFCFQRAQLADAQVPFPWKKVAEVSVGNANGSGQEEAVVIGQRISAAEALARAAARRTAGTGRLTGN